MRPKFLTQEEVDRELGIKPEDLEDLPEVEFEEDDDMRSPLFFAMNATPENQQKRVTKRD